jgi:hypothetical protein
MGAFGAHRFLGKSPPCLGHFDQKRPMLGIISSPRCFKTPGGESLVISCGRHFSRSRSVQPKRGEFVPAEGRRAQAPPLFCWAITLL